MPTQNTKTFRNTINFLGYIAHKHLFTRGHGFTGDKQCVNPSVSTTRVSKTQVSMTRAGKSLGKASLFKTQACPREGGGDAISLNPVFCLLGQGAGLGSLGYALGRALGCVPGARPFQGQLREFLKTITSQVKMMLKNYSWCPKFLILAGFLLGILLIPQELWAATDDLLKDEVGKVEKLLTGGYMRLGLLGVCGFAAIYGVVKQSGWMFVSGIMGCVFVYFMKEWIHTSFPMVI